MSDTDRESRKQGKRQTACKPGSVPAKSRGMVIHLGRPLPDASRDLPGRRRGNPLVPAETETVPPLFDLAPGGVYLATAVTGGAVRSYRTLSPLPAAGHRSLMGRNRKAVCFLWHCPWGRPRRPLAGTVFPWSPDFPPPTELLRQQRSSNCLAMRMCARSVGRSSVAVP